MRGIRNGDELNCTGVRTSRPRACNDIGILGIALIDRTLSAPIGDGKRVWGFARRREHDSRNTSTLSTIDWDVRVRQTMKVKHTHGLRWRTRNSEHARLNADR